MIARLAAAAGLVALAALSIVRVSRPPAPVPASAPDTVFSAERAMRHVEQIAQRPHPMGTADHDRVRDYIVAQLTALGIKPQIQTATAVGTRYPEAGRVQNILGYLPGSASSGKALLLMVHYDGVEAGPAAADDGAGCAALLETLRALRARRTPLRQDIIALFTDGEEAGLLGAAAFVREHPWAKDVAIALNFEARGTSGRSYMFETGPGNLDAVRALRSAGDVTAGSVFTTVYRALPNDTDLSELSLLAVPALNFAFTDGVERYHTSHDDPAHLSPGSLQHHGAQMLAVGKTLANGDLPRPKTGDASFFDLPGIGLVIYPLWVAIPLALLAIALAILVIQRVWRDSLAGAGAMLLTLMVTIALTKFVALRGPAMWSGWYAAAVALVVVAINAAAYLAVRARRPDARTGALLVWLLLAVATTFSVPSVSYMFTWPLLFALIAARSRHPIAEWLSAAVVLLMLAGFAYSVTVIMLGVAGTGAIALGALTALQTWLLAPVLDRLFADARSSASVLLPAAVAAALVAIVTVKPSPEHPVPTSLVYAERADSGDAWFGSYRVRDAWTRGAIGDTTPTPEWTSRINQSAGRMIGHAVPRASLPAPTATFVRDTIIDGARRVIVRINAPRGTTGVVVRVIGAHVSRAAIDARVVDTSRFRYHATEWVTQLWNVPDSGVVLSLAVPPDKRLELEIAARRPGVPPGIPVPARPGSVVPVQSGDVSVVYRRVAY